MGLFQRFKLYLAQTRAGSDPRRQAAEILHAVLPTTVVREDGLYIPQSGLQIGVQVARMEERMAALRFNVLHPSFAEPFEEISVGVGPTGGAALTMAVKGFVSGCLCALRRGMAGDHKRTLNTDFFGTKKCWDVAVGDIVSTGRRPSLPQDGYWDLIAKLLAAHLGNRRHYLVKVYAAKGASGKVFGECRINDTVSRELTDLLELFAEDWKPGPNAFFSDKQFFLLTQREQTRTEYPFTREQVWGHTDRAVELLSQCERGENPTKMADVLANTTGDLCLAVELAGFIPEICAQLVIPGPIYPEKLRLDRCGDAYEAYFDQFTSYSWIRQRITSGFCTGGCYDSAVLRRLTQASATWPLLTQWVRQGGKLEELAVALSLRVPQSYVIR